jgi:hypothetical protein
MSADVRRAGPGLSCPVTVARSSSEVRRLEKTWRSLPVSNVDADIDYFLAMVDNDPAVVRPHVVLIEPPGRGPILCVARLVDRRYPLKLGYRTLASPRARTIVVAFDGVLGVASEADYRLVLTALDDALRSGEADAFLFQQVDQSDPLVGAVAASFPARRRAHGLPRSVRWTARLPESWESFLAARSAKSRRQIRYDDNRFRRTFGDSLTLRRLDRPEHRHRLFDDLETVARSSYQRRIGVGTDGSDRERAQLSFALEHDWLRTWMLYLDDQPVAFWWGLSYAGTFSVHAPAYDPAYGKHRVGYFTMRRMIEDLCDDPAVTTLDFGHGDADYKERFGTRSSTSAPLLVFANRPRPLALNAALSAVAAGSRLAKDVVERSPWAQQIKRRLRSPAAAPADAPGGDAPAEPGPGSQ